MDDPDPDHDPEFSIDSSYELALYIWSEGKGVSFIHEPKFCVNKKDNCSTFVNSFNPCDDPVPEESLYFAVKTYSKFHENRIGALKKTWAKYAVNIRYFSDIQDNSIPTISLNIPNTENGHCAKTFAILEFAYKEIQNYPKIRWVVITDDDTIISPYRLRQLLSCYKSSKNLALGERYGYRVCNMDGYGYNYITGGGGTVLSSKLVEKIIKNAEMCECPNINSPDDMFLGVCLSRLDIPVIHSPQFHQARPNDYAPEYLSVKEAVSFHKHWMINPVEIYEKWFEQNDKLNSNNVKEEL